MYTYTRQELANKIDYEGGIYEMLFGYGLMKENIDPTDVELYEAFSEISDLMGNFAKKVEAFTDLLPEPKEDW